MKRVVLPPQRGPLKGPTARPCPACGAAATRPCRFDDGAHGGDDTVHVERIWAGMDPRERPPFDTGSLNRQVEYNPGRDAVNYAYSISPEFGEAAMMKLGQIAEQKRPPWWRWTTWLAIGIVIQRNRQRRKPS